MPKSISDIQNEILEEFALFNDWTEKYQHIIDIGNSISLIDPQFKDEKHLIKGCQSQVWLHAEKVGDRLHFTADSDAAITKGLIALLLRIYSDHTPQEILDSELFVLREIDLESHLSPSRANGLNQMVKQITTFAEQAA